ncbi:MAG: hypothetical protein P8X96_09675 [Desulfobacteraceae bacterium]|jgi:hypothetical protein
MKKFNIQSSNIIYLGVCLFGIVAFFLVGIYPNLNSLREMDQEIATLNQEVQAQELLFPVYLKLLADITNKIPTKLPIPDRVKISFSDLGRINESFSKLAGECNVTFVSAIADASNYLEDRGRLSMTATFTGDFFDLRSLILKICRLPYLESLDQMRIETVGNRKQIEFKIKVSQK